MRNFFLFLIFHLIISINSYGLKLFLALLHINNVTYIDCVGKYLRKNLHKYKRKFHVFKNIGEIQCIIILIINS